MRASSLFLLLVCSLWALSACTTIAPPPVPRPAAELPEHLTEGHRLRHPVIEKFLVPIADEPRIFRGTLRCGEQRADFHLALPENHDRSKGQLPFILCLTILGGGGELMQFLAERMAARGYAVAWTRRAGSAVRPGQRGAEIQRLFDQTILTNRMVLAWARQQPDFRSDGQAVFGLSTGGIVGTILLALEPELAGGVIALAGADLPSLMAKTTENRVTKWRRWRAEADGASQSQIERELRRELRTDPGRYAPYVATHKVLIVGATFDTVVPTRNQDLLWESFGRPQRLLLPLAHFTAVLAIGRILDRADDFLQSRLPTAE